MNNPKNLEQFRAAVLADYPRLTDKDFTWSVEWHDDTKSEIPRYTCTAHVYRHPSSSKDTYRVDIHYYPAFKSWERIRSYPSEGKMSVVYTESGKSLSSIKRYQ